MKKFLLLLWVLSLCLWVWNLSYAQEDPDDGINFEGSCLRGMGTNCFNYEKIIGIEKEQSEKYTVKWITQDAIFAATYMVWTVLTIIIVWCGLGYIFASSNWKDTSKYKKWLIYAAVWALLVRWWYAIVRLIQYIAKW